MMRDEREEYGDEARDVIEGLRRLAQRVETPPDLPSTILARGAQLLPPREARRTRWWTVVAGWRPHPLAWAPVVAVAFFIAGVLVPWPRTGMSLQDAMSEKPSPSSAQLSSKEALEGSPASPAMPFPPLRQERRQPFEPAPAPPEPRRMLARQTPSQVSSPSPITVTATLPAELYEQLQQEAQRRRISLAAILREAVEAYAQSQKPED
jgi:hypothetical protein